MADSDESGDTAYTTLSKLLDVFHEEMTPEEMQTLQFAAMTMGLIAICDEIRVLRTELENVWRSQA